MFGNRLYAWKTIPMSRLFGGTSVMSLPSIDHPARGRPVEARDEAERGRLAAARRPEQRDELARRDVEIDPGEGDDLPEPAVQLLQLDVGHGLFLPLVLSAPCASAADGQQRQHRRPGDPEREQRHRRRPDTPCSG